VLGSPIAHSLSPALHRAAYAALGLDGWRYDAVEVTEDELAGFVRGLDRSWAGLSLTMPLKRAVLPLLAGRSPLAAAVGAVNTVTFPAAPRTATTTDVHGIVAALTAAGVQRADGVGAATLLGGGRRRRPPRSRRCASWAAPSPSSTCATRPGPRPVEAADRLGVRPRTAPLDAASVAALPAPQTAPRRHGAPLHVAGGRADALAPALARARPLAGTTTPVLARRGLRAVAPPGSGRRGSRRWRVVGGLEMLLHQAAEQVRLMTGRPARWRRCGPRPPPGCAERWSRRQAAPPRFRHPLA
jgi:shikimate dehydrogenase